MNDKQARFAREYLVDMNATAAAISAGYSEKTAPQQASRLLKNVNVMKVIEKGREKLEKKTSLNAEWVIKQLQENHDLAREYGELAQSNKAVELIGKQLGMFSDRIQHEGDVTIKVVTGIAAGVGSRVKHGD